MNHHQDARIQLTKNEGNEIIAVQLLIEDRAPIRTFEDSRLADPIITVALDLLEKYDRGEITASQAADAF